MGFGGRGPLVPGPLHQEQTMKLLLHICCGPCAIYPVEVLGAQGHHVEGYFDNPNIHPHQEFLRRVQALEDYAAQVGLHVIWNKDYDIEEYFRLVAFREGERCRFCYQLRLNRAARAARARGFEAFSSTLLYSRYQQHDLIQDVARQAAAEAGVEFYYEDFRRGWAEGVAQSKAMGLYRQNYCGCLFSERERSLRPRKRARRG
jgi:predicted adenine nucleotide alpha hydrolase (AANH) superfamily ATPase